MSQDRQPLLPTHVNHSQHRLSTTRISFPSSSSSALDGGDAEGSESSTLIGSSAATTTTTKARPAGDRIALPSEGRREGLPKLSRECLWSEIKCYGSYIVPVLLVFGVLVVGASLAAVGWRKGWFDRE